MHRHLRPYNDTRSSHNGRLVQLGNAECVLLSFQLALSLVLSVFPLQHTFLERIIPRRLFHIECYCCIH